MATISYPKFKAFTNTDAPANGYFLYTLSPGTTWPTGAKTAYTDKAMANAAANPVVLDANGEALVYGPGQYKLTLTDANGIANGQVWTVDNVDGIGTSTNFQSISSYGLSLANANANMAANGGFLLIDQPITVGASLSLSSKIVLGVVKCANNGSSNVNITMANAATLLINSPFTPVDFPCFANSGITFAANTLTSPLSAVMWGGGSGGAANANAASANFVGTLTPNSATPDVGGGLPTYKTNNSQATVITNFANGVAGQGFQTYANDAYTSVQLGTNILGMGGSNSTLQLFSGDMLTCTYDGSKWHAIGSSPAVQMFRNRFINGEMRIDQRNAGASQTIANSANLTPANLTYTVDRWGVAATGANVTSQQVGGAGQFKNYLQISGAANNTGVSITQRIESINILDQANQTVSLSAYIATSSNMTVTWTAYTPPASNDTWTGSDTQIATGTWAANSTLTQYTATIPGANMANATRGLEIVLSIGALVSGHTLALTGAQLEPGGWATPFERRPDDVEIARCQRYLPCWQPRSFVSPIGVGGASNTTSGIICVPLPVPPRVPANGMYGPTSGLNVYTAAYSGIGLTGISLQATSYTAVLLSISTASGLTTGQVIFLQWYPSGTPVLYLTGCEL